jgi:hypothetical protein
LDDAKDRAAGQRGPSCDDFLPGPAVVLLVANHIVEDEKDQLLIRAESRTEDKFAAADGRVREFFGHDNSLKQSDP